MKLSNSAKVFKREFRALFNSPVAYIIMTLFLVTTGWFFFSTYFLANQVEMRGFFSLLPLILTFTIPALTMRVFAEEYRSGSYEILVTLPVSRLEVVMGKYFSSLMMVLVRRTGYGAGNRRFYWRCFSGCQLHGHRCIILIINQQPGDSLYY